MTLQAAGVADEERSLRRGIRWLSAAAIADHNNSYWSLGPISVLAPPPTALAAREIKEVETILEKRSKPHPDQLVEAFYLRVLTALNMPGKASLRTQCMDAIRAGYDPSTGWSNRPDTTSDGYALVYEFDTSFAEQIRPTVVELLKRRADVNIPARMWGSPISTCYTIMNMVSTDLAEDAQLASMVDQAVVGLQGAQKYDHWILERADLPYGGAGDIHSNAYITAVIIRALIAAASRKTNDYLFVLEKAAHRSRTRRLGVVTVALSVLATIAILTPAENIAASMFLSLFDSAFIQQNKETIPFVIGTFLALFGIFASVFPEQVREFFGRWIRWLR